MRKGGSDELRDAASGEAMDKTGTEVISTKQKLSEDGHKGICKKPRARSNKASVNDVEKTDAIVSNTLTMTKSGGKRPMAKVGSLNADSVEEEYDGPNKRKVVADDNIASAVGSPAKRRVTSMNEKVKQNGLGGSDRVLRSGISRKEGKVLEEKVKRKMSVAERSISTDDNKKVAESHIPSVTRDSYHLRPRKGFPQQNLSDIEIGKNLGGSSAYAEGLVTSSPDIEKTSMNSKCQESERNVNEEEAVSHICSSIRDSYSLRPRKGVFPEQNSNVKQRGKGSGSFSVHVESLRPCSVNSEKHSMISKTPGSGKTTDKVVAESYISFDIGDSYNLRPREGVFPKQNPQSGDTGKHINIILAYTGAVIDLNVTDEIEESPDSRGSDRVLRPRKITNTPIPEISRSKRDTDRKIAKSHISSASKDSYNLRSRRGVSIQNPDPRREGKDLDNALASVQGLETVSQDAGIPEKKKNVAMATKAATKGLQKENTADNKVKGHKRKHTVYTEGSAEVNLDMKKNQSGSADGEIVDSKIVKRSHVESDSGPVKDFSQLFSSESKRNYGRQKKADNRDDSRHSGDDSPKKIDAKSMVKKADKGKGEELKERDSTTVKAGDDAKKASGAEIPAQDATKKATGQSNGVRRNPPREGRANSSTK